MTYVELVNQLTRQYNELIRNLELSYDRENSQLGWSLMGNDLRDMYSKRYEAIYREYHYKKQQLLNNYKATHTDWAKKRQLWGWLFVFVILAGMGSCISQMPVQEEQQTVSTLVADGQQTYWNADNIPIPFLKDSTQYVSNPDHILSVSSVDRMNGTLQRLRQSLGVESVVIIVNHIEHDDPFRMAQDVGNKYGIGRQDRGLVVVVGYGDHSINISPGRALEADLTDAECYRLQQQYVIPAMRKEMPDSAMIYLTEAIYSTLQKKQMPQMSLYSASDAADDEMATLMGIYLLFFIAWGIFYLHLNRQYQWLSILGATTLLANPFYQSSHTGFFIGGGGGGGSFGGGGFSGGSFGGGSFGGGGATSRW